jgi:hypothetical protein
LRLLSSGELLDARVKVYVEPSKVCNRIFLIPMSVARLAVTEHLVDPKSPNQWSTLVKVANPG